MSSLSEFAPPTIYPPVPINKDMKYYPKKDEFMKALQDPGVPDEKQKGSVFKFPVLKRACEKIWVTFKELNVENLPTNKSRGSLSILKCITTRRQLKDKVDVYPSLAEYGAEDSSQVFILQNDEQFFGFDIVLTLYFNYLSSKGNKKEVSRSPDDAIRVAGILLDPEHRASVLGMLSGVRSREKCDQSVDPSLAFAHTMLQKFKDDEYEVQKPRTINEDDIIGVDPNNSIRIDMDRDSQWILDTFKKYIKPKYKSAIHRWDTTTGMGSCEPYEFSKFCDTNNRWLVWVYLMDKEQGYLLFSNAKGKPPRSVGSEVGFEPNRLSEDEVIAITKAKSKRKREDVDVLLQYTQNSSEKVSGLLDRVDSMLSKCDVRSHTNHSVRPSIGQDFVEETDIINRLLVEQEKRTKLMSLTMDRRLRANVLNTIDKLINSLGEELKKITDDKADNN